jgi:hypothetical protein
MSADDQMKLLMEQHQRATAKYAQSQLERSSDLIERFTKLAATKGIALTPDSFSFIQTIGIVATAPGLAKTLLGACSIEKDGIFAFEDIAARMPTNRFQEGYFIGDDYMLMAHPCYRRGMHPVNNWAPRFVDLFWNFDSPDVKKYIAIDEDRVRINVDDSAYMERDTWYGAPFDEDISKIKVGTIKLTPPLDLDTSHVNLFFAQAYCLDIKWSESQQVKTFQALEIKTHDVQVIIDDQTFFPARYLHAEFDLSSGAFRHFDGAIQLFTENEYLRRRVSDFNMAHKSTEHIKARSRKVFKLNGSLPVTSWVEFCCHFFAGNPLTFEYFTGAYPDHVASIVDKVCARR